MAKDSPEVKDREASPRDATEEVVLRDESDEIIDNLKAQLESLQSQLTVYRSRDEEADREDADTPGGADDEALLAAWNASLTPHLAFRLQEPAEELTRRLERLIEQAGDPELRAELERCRDLAFFFYETFNKISNNHQLLTESLTAPRAEVELADFCRLLEQPLPGRAAPLAVERLGGVPRQATFASRSAASVLKTLAEMAAGLFKAEPRIVVTPGEAPPQGVEGAQWFKFVIACEGAGTEAGDGEEVSAFAIRNGITANTVVDLLYVEKIVELQDGRFAFHRRGGRVHGFEVLVPYRGGSG